MSLLTYLRHRIVRVRVGRISPEIQEESVAAALLEHAEEGI